MKWGIYHKDKEKEQDVKYLETNNVTYSGEWMGDEFVTTTIKSDLPIDFEIGDYILYRGEKYYLGVIPTVQKQAKTIKDDGVVRGVHKEAFVYESVKFYSIADELTRCKFLDVVLEQNSAYYTGLPDFNFFCNSVIDLADRVKANLDRVYVEEEEWTVKVSLGGDNYYIAGVTATDHAKAVGNKNKPVSVNNNSVWDALALVNSEFDTTFYIKGRTIIIGDTGDLLSRYFAYGKNNGLFKIDKTTDDSQQIVTRLRAYGNSSNMPTRYYNHLGKRFYSELSNTVHGYFDNKDDFKDALKEYFDNADEIYDNHTDGKGYYVFTEQIGKGCFSFVDEDGFGVVTVLENEVETKIAFYSDYSIGGTIFFLDSAQQTIYNNLYGGRLYFTKGIVKDLWVSSWYDMPIDYHFPDNMNCKYLMLPAFPKNSLKEWADASYDAGDWKGDFSTNKSDPYIDSPNVKQLGVREATVFFDGSEDREDIFPKIEYIKDDKGNPLNYIMTGSSVGDNGVFDGNVNVPDFWVTIPDIGFDINDYRTAEDAVISMKDGRCGGREFVILNCKEDSEGGEKCYKLKLGRTEDSGLDMYFPNRDNQIMGGDKFVLLGIDLPEKYVEAASAELFVKAVEWLKNNDYAVFKYSLNVDNVFMAKQHDYAIESKGEPYEEESIHDTIKAGRVLHFDDDDLNVSASITIDRLEIKEGEQRIPHYTITLSEEKSVGTMQRIMQKIDSVANGGGNGGGYNTSEIETIIQNFGSRHFLRKDVTDTALGKITFAKGFASKKDASFGNFVKDSSGAGIYQDASGNWHFEGDYFKVRKKLEAAELEIMKTSHIGGRIMNTAANCVVSKVEDHSTFYRCYFDAEDGEGLAVDNLWRQFDQAICQTFNIINSETGGYENHYYWRLVVSTGSEILQGEGKDTEKKYHYIDLSNTKDLGILGEGYIDGSTPPMVGDHIVQLGHRIDTEEGRARSNAIILSPVSVTGDSADAPYIMMYKGIAQFTYPNPRVQLSPKKVSITAEEIHLLAHEGEQEGEGDYIDLMKWVNGADDNFEDIHNQLDESFLVWQVDYEAPRDSDNNVLPISISDEPSNNWGTEKEPYSEHVGDFVITSDGVCYKFVSRSSNIYAWEIVTDEYLIQAIRQINDINDSLRNMADDMKISYLEKPQLLTLWNNTKAEYTQEYINGATFLTQEHHAVVNYANKYKSLMVLMETILDKSTWTEDINISDQWCMSLEGVEAGFLDTWSQYQTALVELQDTARQVINAKADEALGKLEEYADDNKLTSLEKRAIAEQLSEFAKEYETYIKEAEYAAEDDSDYKAAYLALYNFFYPNHIGDDTIDITTAVDKEEYNKVFADYFDEREKIALAYDAVVNDTMKGLDELGDDGKITPYEKTAIITPRLDAIVAEKEMYVGIAEGLGVSSKEYEDAYDAFKALLESFLENMDVTSAIDRDEYQKAYTAYEESKTALMKVLSDTTSSNKEDLKNQTLDNCIQAGEKSQLALIWGAEKSVYDSLMAQAEEYDVDSDDFKAAYEAIKAKMDVILVLTNGAYTDTEFTSEQKTAYDALWDTYYEEQENLRNAIVAVVNALADEASKAADEATHRLDQMSADNKISPEEKKTLEDRWKSEVSDYNSLLNDITAYEVSDDDSKDFKDAYAVLKTMMDAILTKDDDGKYTLTDEEEFATLDFDGKWKTYLEKKEGVKELIADYIAAIKDKADDTESRVEDTEEKINEIDQVLKNISDDGVITEGEKVQYQLIWISEREKANQLLADYLKYAKGLKSDDLYSDLEDAITDLQYYLNTNVFGAVGDATVDKDELNGLWDDLRNTSKSVSDYLADVLSGKVGVTDLQEVGVSFGTDGSYIITAEKTIVQDRRGNAIALFTSDNNGNASLNAELIKTNKVEAYNTIVNEDGTERKVLVSAYNGNGQGTLVYYYPNGKVMKEDVFTYDSAGNVSGMRTNYYDTSGKLKWYMTENGSFGETLDFYWTQRKMYKITAVDFLNFVNSLPSGTGMSQFPADWEVVFNEFRSSSGNSNYDSYNGMVTEDSIESSTTPDTVTPYDGYIAVNGATALYSKNNFVVIVDVYENGHRVGQQTWLSANMM